MNQTTHMMADFCAHGVGVNQFTHVVTCLQVVRINQSTHMVTMVCVQMEFGLTGPLTWWL